MSRRAQMLDALMRRSIETVAAMTPLERRRMAWRQRGSWVYGNLAVGNPRVTREMVEAIVTEEYGPCP